MKILKLLCLALCMGVVSTHITAETISRLTDNGTSGKMIALGTVEGLHAQASVVNENPAGMMALTGLNTSMYYTTMMDQETQYMSLASVFSSGRVRLGLGLTQMTVPNIDHTAEVDNVIVVEDTFAVYESQYTVALATSLTSRFDIGLSVQYYLQDLYVSQGEGVNLDIGAVYRRSRITQSFTLKNALQNSRVQYSEGYGNLDFPLQMLWGTQIELTNTLSAYTQIKHRHGSSKYIKSIGGEWKPIAFEGLLDLYAGWTEVEVANLLKDRVSLGLGLNLNPMSIQFVYEHTDYFMNPGHYGISVNLKL